MPAADFKFAEGHPARQALRVRDDGNPRLRGGAAAREAHALARARGLRARLGRRELPLVSQGASGEEPHGRARERDHARVRRDAGGDAHHVRLPASQSRQVLGPLSRAPVRLEEREEGVLPALRGVLRAVPDRARHAAQLSPAARAPVRADPLFVPPRADRRARRAAPAAHVHDAGHAHDLPRRSAGEGRVRPPVRSLALLDERPRHPVRDRGARGEELLRRAQGLRARDRPQGERADHSRSCGRSASSTSC